MTSDWNLWMSCDLWSSQSDRFERDYAEHLREYTSIAVHAFLLSCQSVMGHSEVVVKCLLLHWYSLCLIWQCFFTLIGWADVGAMFASNRLSGTASCWFVKFMKRLPKKMVTQPLQPLHENCRLVPGQGDVFCSWSHSCIASLLVGLTVNFH